MQIGKIAAAGILGTVLSACSPLGAIDRLVPDTGYQREAGLAYGPDARQKLDVYRPAGALKSKAAIVFLYGGSWRKGDRDKYRFVGQLLASQGYLVVIPDYRLYPTVRFPSFVEDAAAAVGWVHREIAARGGDPNRIVVAGHSAGAHSAALIALDPSYLKAAHVPREALAGLIGLSGPYGFDPATIKSTRPIFAPAVPPGAARPITFAGANAPPTLLIHGDQDWTVSPRNSVELTQRLSDAGGKVTYVPVADTGHAGIILGLAQPFHAGGPVLRLVTDFVDSL